MGNMITNVYSKSNYDRLRINKAIGIFRRSDWDLPGPKTITFLEAE